MRTPGSPAAPARSRGAPDLRQARAALQRLRHLVTPAFLDGWDGEFASHLAASALLRPTRNSAHRAEELYQAIAAQTVEDLVIGDVEPRVAVVLAQLAAFLEAFGVELEPAVGCSAGEV